MENGNRTPIDVFTLISPLPLTLETLIGELLSMASSEATDFTSKWEYADICFLVEGKKLFANKMILSMWSPVFTAMFNHDFKEKTADSIELPGKKYDDVLALLKVLHPPNDDITDASVVGLLPLVQEYQMERVLERCEEHLLAQANCVTNFLVAQRFGLSKLLEANQAYLTRAPISRLRKQPEFDKLERAMLVEILMDKCERFEGHMDALREVRMVLERKKPTTFPGVHLLCDDCTGAREQQVDCHGCMKGCCKKITEVLRNMER